MNKWFKNIGPGTLVAAAFIGPGTVTLCTIAGVQFGFELLWAMTLSIIATVILQEMAARIGIISQKGLADVIKDQLTNRTLQILVLFLILAAIVIGNGAYEAGNITGAALGLSSVFGNEFSDSFPIVIGLISFGLLFIGNYKFLERTLIVLVLLMSFSFFVTAFLTKPNIWELLNGAFVPSFPDQSIFVIIGLVGTTVVPYNLFLHAALVKEKWKQTTDLRHARKDTYISIVLGGFVSMSIIISAAVIDGGNIENVLDLAKGLEPLYGSAAKYFLGLGLFAAGITSSITAPLAAAYVVNSCFGWNAKLNDFRFRMAWIVIVLIGVIFSYLKFSPIEIIKFAQVTNGLLLPIVAILILWIVNKTSIMGKYKNSAIHNVLSIFIILITLILGIKSILKVFELL